MAEKKRNILSGKLRAGVHSKNAGAIVKSGIFLSISLAVILLGICLAWFSANKNIQSDTLSLAAGSSEFELKSKGTPSDTDDLLEELGYAYGTTEADSKGNIISNESSGEVRSVKWLMSQNSNMNNYSGISDEDSGISPGSSGVVTFYVIPKKTGSLTVKFKLKMTAYSENSDEQSSDDGEITLSDITALDEDSEAAQYLKGHLLYFLSYENGVYSERITDDGFSITFKDAKADEEQEVNIYWVWPYSFGQMVLKSSDENLIVLNRSGIFADSSDEKTETAKLIKNSPEIFFRSKNSDAFDSEGNLIKKYKDEIDKMCSGTEYARSYYLNLCSAYNDADQCIGEQIQYILTTVEADC